ncbi:MAG TPA: UDP-N-acetylmuramoyl-tripeptide--D-alanyl-D-alanine ligase [Acidimicrobiales bacterium]|nr:UDP-N-acetylmuramoyl-tripeptide--D-alanyl-D-alanine ligase [Acidimicrobiales bacterium]
MRWRAQAVADAVGGARRGPDVDVTGVTVDSRRVGGGELFVPVRAARDGHDFIGAAVDAGAAAYLTEREPPAARGTAIVVRDTLAALADLGRAARRRLPDRVVGVTGSAGKTSTKDLLAAALGPAFRTTASERSFNNELGVPLTLANAPDGTEVAVVELGARGPGHIRQLCELARPTIGVVTNVGLAHTEMLGSLEGVAAAKSELVAALPPSGWAVLNADDERVAAMAAATAAQVLTFGVTKGEVRATGLVLDDELRPTFRLVSPWGEAEVRLEARGAHHAANAAAAAAAALAAGAPLEKVVDGLARAGLSPWRMELRRAAGGGVVLNDAYNANPSSTAAALRALAALPASRRVAVLGPMLELGEHSRPEHRRMGDLARDLGVDRLITVGAPDYGGEDVSDLDEAAALVGTVGPGDAVLVKGSRAAGLERLAAGLVGDDDRRPGTRTAAREAAAW